MAQCRHSACTCQCTHFFVQHSEQLSNSTDIHVLLVLLCWSFGKTCYLFWSSSLVEALDSFVSLVDFGHGLLQRVLVQDSKVEQIKAIQRSFLLSENPCRILLQSLLLVTPQNAPQSLPGSILLGTTCGRIPFSGPLQIDPSWNRCMGEFRMGEVQTHERMWPPTPGSGGQTTNGQKKHIIDLFAPTQKQRCWAPRNKKWICLMSLEETEAKSDPP